MKKIVLPIAVCLILLIGCGAPAVVQPVPEVAVPAEVPTEPILVWEPVVEEPIVEEPVVEEPIEEEPYIPTEIKRPYEPYQPLPPPPTPEAHPFWRDDAPTLEERDAWVRERIESGTWGVRVTFPEFGSGTAFYFYEPNPDYLPGSYATEDEDAQARSRVKEQFVYEDTGVKRYTEKGIRCEAFPNPTYAEVLAFMEEAEIGKLDGRLLPGYNGHNGCTLVSIEVKKSANERGIRCANLVASRDPIGHALNAFETTDKGIVWFDQDTERTPCFGREDLFPLPWLDGGPMPTSIIRPLKYVVYIW